MRPTLCFLLLALPAFTSCSFFDVDFLFQNVKIKEDARSNKTVIPITFNVSDIGSVLRTSMNISEEIQALNEQILKMQASLADIDVYGRDQLKAVNAEVANANSSVNALKNRIEDFKKKLSVFADALSSNNDTLQCMSQQGCVTEEPPYTGPTTPRPPPTCEGAINVPTYGIEVKSPYFDELLPGYLCAYTIKAPDGYTLNYEILQLNMNGEAQLTVTYGKNTDSYTSEPTTSEPITSGPSQVISTSTAVVQMTANATVGEISYDVKFTAYSPCNGYDCGNGTCSVVANQPTCICSYCYVDNGANPCSIWNDPCVSIQRKCDRSNKICEKTETKTTCTADCVDPPIAPSVSP